MKTQDKFKKLVKDIEQTTKKHLSPFLQTALLEEFQKDLDIHNPEILAEKFIQELNGESYYFIEEVTRRMLWKAQMCSKLTTV